MVGMKGYHHLTDQEREILYLENAKHTSLRAIAQRLGCSHSTVSRELARNSDRSSEGLFTFYSPSQADQLAHQRRSQSSRHKLDDASLQRFVIQQLTRGWTPEQIAGRLKLKAPRCVVSHETIYQFIYKPEHRHLRLWEFLRRVHRRRQAWRGRRSHTGKHLKIPNRISIAHRPAEANQRQRVGHFESDLMQGRQTDPTVISVTVDRKSGYVLLEKLSNKAADLRAEHLSQTLGHLPFRTRTVTFDNGSENTEHEQVAKHLGCQTFFCDAYQAWEKGSVENAIGLLRWYIPKKTSLGTVTLGDLHTIQHELNDRPRKRLGFYTPSEVVYNETGWCI